MPIINRRDFMKHVGLFTFLVCSGNISKGFPFSPIKNIETHSISSQVEQLFESKARVCFLGTKGIGFQLTKLLTKTVDDHNFEVHLFSPQQRDLISNLANSAIIFLAGEIENRDFWIARELCISVNPILLVTMINNRAKLIFKNKTTNFPANSESIIILPPKNPMEIAIKTIQDIYSFSWFPSLLCLDFADVRSILQNSIGFPFICESSFENSENTFNSYIKNNFHHFQHADKILCIFSFDNRYEDKITLDHVNTLSEYAYSVVSDNCEIVWGIDHIRTLSVDFRATIVLLT